MSTITRCDFCGAEIPKVQDGIFIDDPRVPCNSGRLEITRLNNRGNIRYDICPNCLARITAVLESIREEDPEKPPTFQMIEITRPSLKDRLKGFLGI